MHHFDGLRDVEAFPVATPEGVGTSNLANELTQVDIAILESIFSALNPFSGITGVSEHLHVDGFDHSLGTGFCATDTGLSASAWKRIPSSGDLLQT